MQKSPWSFGQGLLRLGKVNEFSVRNIKEREPKEGLVF